MGALGACAPVCSHLASLEPGTEVGTKNCVGLQEPRSLCLRGAGREPAGTLEGNPAGPGISELPTPLIPPVDSPAVLMTQDYRDLGCRKGNCFMPIKKKKERKLALGSFGVRKMTLKPASRILFECFWGDGGSEERGWAVVGDLATWLFCKGLPLLESSPTQGCALGPSAFWS